MIPQAQQIQQQQAQSQQQIASIVHQQNISTWNAYYQEQAQRNSLPANAPPVYFQHPIQARHSYHQEESTIYQNCQGVAMEQNHYGQSIVARSPTRRPESPPPLRNYHQTMVLIPYNTETYAQFTTADQIAAQQFHHQNILEYQQVCNPFELIKYECRIMHLFYFFYPSVGNTANNSRANRLSITWNAIACSER